MVLGRADEHPEGHRFLGGVARAGTEHHDLCVGDLEHMRTDTRGLLDAGLALSVAAWEEAKASFDWSDMDALRQPPDLAGPHERHVRVACGIDPDRVPRTFPTRGNIGPASVPFTLAGEVETLSRRRPGAPHGHRLRPQRLLRRDRLVTGPQ